MKKAVFLCLLLILAAYQVASAQTWTGEATHKDVVDHLNSFSRALPSSESETDEHIIIGGVGNHFSVAVMDGTTEVESYTRDMQVYEETEPAPYYTNPNYPYSNSEDAIMSERRGLSQSLQEKWRSEAVKNLADTVQSINEGTNGPEADVDRDVPQPFFNKYNGEGQEVVLSSSSWGYSGPPAWTFALILAMSATVVLWQERRKPNTILLVDVVDEYEQAARELLEERR